MNTTKLTQVNTVINTLNDAIKAAAPLNNIPLTDSLHAAMLRALNLRCDIEDTLYGGSRDVIEAFRSAGFKVARYSGRCMNGEFCVGVTVDYTLAAAIAKAGRYLANPEVLDGMRSDALGLQTIAYWPHLSWPPDVVEDTDGE